MSTRTRGRRALLSVLLVVVLVAGAGAACTGGVTPPGGGSPGHVTISYVPNTVIPASVGSRMGMVNNRLALNVPKPCPAGCYVTSMQASLVKANGQPANVNNGLWLHHMVLSSSGGTDPICPIGGDHFFASGNERTKVDLAAAGNYGYRVNATDSWTLLYDLMNMTTTAQAVTIQVTYDYVPLSTPGIRPVQPLWIDIAQCAGSNRPAQQGQYSYSQTWTVNRPGRLVDIHGHMHDGATHMTITQNGRLICDSVQHYGETPAYVEGPGSDMPGMPHISSADTCREQNGVPVATLRTGDRVTITAYYDSNAHMQMGTEPIMGIAHGWIDPA